MQKSKKSKKSKKKELLYFDDYGILRFDLGGKILLLFLTEIAVLWVSFMLLSKWEFFVDTKHGLAIMISNVIFLSVTFISIYFKDFFFDVYHTEMAKQVSNLLFFAMVFLILYYYTPEEIDEKVLEKHPNRNLYFYTNPVSMTYAFVLIYLVCFYILFNATK